MDNTKKILITTESFETFVLRVNRRGHAFGHCIQCDREVEVLSIDQAVSMSGIRTSELIRRIDLSDIHATETEAGHYLICSNSVSERVRPAK